MSQTTTVDSFKFLWEQIEQEAVNTFSDTRDVLAVIGALYVVRKICRLCSEILDAISVHFVGQRNVKWVEKYGPWAVVTGGSEGIGRSYAHELACRGLNIVLISRNEHKLVKAKTEIEADCHVKVEYIVADFASENQSQLYRTITEKLQDKTVGLLVNNVGVMYDYPDVLLNVSSQKLWQLIHVNIGAATMMTHLLLPPMVERGKGGIVVVSSGSSVQITPQMTVYSATKRYLDYFVQGLAYEYRHSGVTFQCLVPFYTATRMTGYSKNLSNSGIMIPSPQVYARSAVRTLGKSSFTTGYFPHTLQLWIAKSVPSWLWMWTSSKLNSALRKEALERTLKAQQKKGADGQKNEEKDKMLDSLCS